MKRAVRGRWLVAVAQFFLPLAVMLSVYGAQGWWVEGLRGQVRVAEPRAWELAWFGVATADGGKETPAAWWQRHTHPVLDVACGAIYLLYVPIFVAAAAWWRFGRGWRQADRAMWAMAIVNLAGYTVHLIYPVAPPWYAEAHGTGPAKLDTPSDPAGVARFDAALGVDWGARFYSGATNVFGAMPSLHVALAFLGLLYAWRLGSLRAAMTLQWGAVLFGSVYLNHHYIVDGLCGMALAAVVFAGAEMAARRQTGTAGAAQRQTR